MSQTFVEGTRVSITLVKAGPCVVTQIKRTEKDGYWAVQLGFGERKIKNISKALQGHLRGVIKETKAPRFLREVKVDEEPKFKVGDTVTVREILKPGDLVQVTGISKGKGFAGVVKRWHFKGGPKTHGQSDRERAPGSIGQTTTPGRVHKGKHMAGRMGGEKTSIKNLRVVTVDSEKNEIALSGPIPGASGKLVIIKKLASVKLEELIEEASPQAQVEEIGEASDEKNESENSKNEVEVKEEEKK